MHLSLHVDSGTPDSRWTDSDPRPGQEAGLGHAGGAAMAAEISVAAAAAIRFVA